MDDVITIDTTSGGFYLGCTRLDDGKVGITVSKADSKGNPVKVLNLVVTPSNAKELSHYMTEFAKSILEESEQ